MVQLKRGAHVLQTLDINSLFTMNQNADLTIFNHQFINQTISKIFDRPYELERGSALFLDTDDEWHVLD